MIRALKLCPGIGYDPYENLALEQRLLETVEEEQCILYLWQNAATVVIGRNQCAWKECRFEALQKDGGSLARRCSGGGAVFHDLGNLNYSFLTTAPDSDVPKQLSVILAACDRFGIPAQVSGRNDITAFGRKFSGSAFYTHQGRSLHHGTLLVDVDQDRMTRYLNPPVEKLRARGVDSVRARVVNLREITETVTVKALEAQLADAFQQVYGLPLETLNPQRVMDKNWEDLLARNRSWDWNYGQKLPFTWRGEKRFDWGGVELYIQTQGGIVTGVRVYTDALDADLSQTLETALVGCRFDAKTLKAALLALHRPTSCLKDITSIFSEMENET